MASFFLASSWLCRLYTITRSAFFQNCITCKADKLSQRCKQHLHTVALHTL